jgi:hypothetical protein
VPWAPHCVSLHGSVRGQPLTALRDKVEHRVVIIIVVDNFPIPEITILIFVNKNRVGDSQLQMPSHQETKA